MPDSSIAGYLSGTKSPARNKAKIKRLSQLARQKYAQGYEFVPQRVAKKTLTKRQKAVNRFFPGELDGEVKGVWIPRRTAGPRPKLKFKGKDLQTIEIRGRDELATDYVPLDAGQVELLSTDFERGMAAVDELLAEYRDDDVIVPVSDNDANLNSYGGNKAATRKLLADWIAAYGWTAAPKDADLSDAEGNSTLAPGEGTGWFAGFKVLKP